MAKAVSFLLALILLGLGISCQIPQEEKEILPRVSAVFPSSDTLPENLLRMYLHFSKPMKPIGNLEKIALFDEDDQEIVGAIFNNVHELWDRNQQQLTLIFDPSRVKTGLIAHKEMGRSLQMGKNYKLVIGQLEDVEGNKLKEVYTKTFYASKEDTLPPNTKHWIVKTPKAGSHSPLIVQFPAMLDRQALLHRLQLTDKNSQPISGEVVITKQETEWRFESTEKWPAGDYILYVHGRLEDPCGNNLNGLFDHKKGSLKNNREGAVETIEFRIE